MPHFVDFDGSWKLFVGTWASGVQVYSGISEGDLSAEFTLEDALFGNIWDGYRTHPALADLDADGLYDMLLGNFRGGLSAHITDLVSPVVSTNHPINTALRVFPNPTNDKLQIEWATWDNQAHNLLIYNLLGQELLSKKVVGNRYTVSVANWLPGIYFADLDGEVVKFVVK